jgi:hypothetical protein
MATEGHECGPRKDRQQKSKEEMDGELAEIRARWRSFHLKCSKMQKCIGCMSGP